MNDVDALLAECEQLAEGLAPEDVDSGTLAEFLDAVELRRQGCDAEASAQLEALLQLNEQLRAEYAQLFVEPDEVSAEAVAGHIVLSRGLEGWREALERALRGEDEWSELEEMAEQAHRWMLTLPLFEQGLSERDPAAGLKSLFGPVE